MPPAPDVQVRIKASNETGPAFRGLEQVLGRARSQVAGITSLLSTAAVGAFLGKAIAESADAESKLSALRVSITNVGGDFDGIRGRVDAAAASVQRLSRFSDDAARGALTVLIDKSGDVQASLASLQVVVDLAAARHLDLEDAAEIVGKALAGNTTQLTRLYPTLKSTDAVADLTRMLRGRAAADAETFSGSLQQAKNALSDILETTGNVITRNGLLSGALQSAARNIKEVTENNRAMTDAVVSGTLALAGGAAAAGGLATVLKVLKVGIAGLGAAAGPVGLAIAGVSIVVGILAGKSAAAAERVAKLREEIAKLSDSQAVLDRITALVREREATPATLVRRVGIDRFGRERTVQVDNPRLKDIDREIELLKERLKALRELETTTGTTAAAEGQELEILKRQAQLHRLDAEDIARLQAMRASLNAELDAGNLKYERHRAILDQLIQVENILASVTKDGTKASGEAAKARADELTALSGLAEKTELTSAQLDRLRQRFEEVTSALTAKNLTDAEQNRLLDEQRQAFEALQRVGAQTSETPAARGSGFGLGPMFPKVDTRNAFKGVQLGRDAVDEASEGLTTFFAGGLGEAFARQMETVREQIRVQVRLTFYSAKDEVTAQSLDLQQSIKQGLGATLTDAIQGALFAAFGQTDLSVFQGFSKAVLAGLGSIFTQMGATMIAASPLFKGISVAMSNPITAGPALALYGAALVALGATLGAIAHGIGGGSRGGGGGSLRGRGSEEEVTRITVQAPSVSRASQLTPARPLIYAPVQIGKSDYQAQRELYEMLSLGAERGLRIRGTRG